MVIGERFAALTEPEASRLLGEAAVAHARVNPVQGLLDHPVLAGPDRWRQGDTPGDPVRALLPPTSIRGVEPRISRVPAVGEHTDRILAELGYPPDGVDALRRAGAV